MPEDVLIVAELLFGHDSLDQIVKHALADGVDRFERARVIAVEQILQVAEDSARRFTDDA